MRPVVFRKCLVQFQQLDRFTGDLQDCQRGRAPGVIVMLPGERDLQVVGPFNGNRDLQLGI